MNATSLLQPEAATGTKMAEPNLITDLAGYARRWGFSKRTGSNLLAEGLPHLKVGSRRVRIIIPEADAWMREQYGTQRRGGRKAA